MIGILVCLRRGYHSVYDELVNYPPKSVEYYIPKLTTPSKSSAVNSVKRKLWRSYVHLFNKPNSIKVDQGKSQLIHSGGGFLIENNFPWVVDVEHAASTVGFEAGRLEKVKNIVEKFFASENCKKIMPWTEAGKNSLLNAFDTSKFSEKIEVVYPAMHKEKRYKRQKSEKPSILFVSVRFFTKGGREVLQAYEKLKEKFDVNLTIVSDVPEELQRKYPDVIFKKPNIPREILLRDYFTKTDIFLLPSFMDTFGMVFLEAMAYSIPIVSTNVFAIPEIVEDAGYVVNVDKYSWYGKDYLFAWDSWEKWSDFVEREEKPELVNEIAEKVSSLIEDTSLRKKMGENGKRLLEKKFSIEERNIRLKRIYEEAAKR